MHTPFKLVSRALLLVLTAGGVASSARAATIEDFRDKPPEWFKTDEGKTVVTNIITWQNHNGGWWKTYDPTQPRVAKPEDIAKNKDAWHRVSTIDNMATHTEMRILSRAFLASGRADAKTSVEKGLKYLLDAQYPTGAWPQRFPLEDNYGRYATFNDTAMVGVIRVMKDISQGAGEFNFLDDAAKKKAGDAYAKGIDYVLNSQIKVKGELTVWCQQHDPVNYEPTGARAYELPSLSGGESADILLMLMEIEKPDARVKASIIAGVKWYEKSKLTGIRSEKKNGDVTVIVDPAAPPLWGRFYDLETGKPYFCGRDGVKRANLADIEKERRTGYAWLRPWGTKVLEAYPKWAAKHEVTEKVAMQ